MSTGGDFWGGRPIEVKNIIAVTLSARVNAVFGTAVTHIVRPASAPRFIAFQVLSNGFWIKPGYHPGRTFVDGDVTVGADTIDDTAHGFTAGDGPYQITNSGGALPDGLAVLTDYFVGVVDDNTYTLHTVHSDAVKDKDRVDITAAAGGGTHTIAFMANANPSATNEDGQEAPFIDSTVGKGGELVSVSAMPEQLTVRGDNVASNMVYWFLP